MMTIKEFASLCRCSTQTLRYYDRIDLLKPAAVDKGSGYRYYAKEQAVDFVKIKNLQAADFSIEEIKLLLTVADQQVCEALDRKMAEQKEKLELIKKIRQSYLSEKNQMEKLVANAADYLVHALKDYEVLREFGLDPAEGPAIVQQLKSYIEKVTTQYLPAAPDVRMVVNGQLIEGAEQASETFEALTGTGYEDTVLIGDENVQQEAGFSLDEQVWTCEGWQHVHEFINSIPDMEQGYEYGFFFQLNDEKYTTQIEFPMFMLAAMLPQAGESAMGCSIEHSTDDRNHFVLMRRQAR